VITPPDPWTTLGRFPFGVASRIRLTKLSQVILLTRLSSRN